MKQIIFIMLAMLTYVQSKACHMIDLGQCSGMSYFETGSFNNNSIFQIRIAGDTNLLFTYVTKETGSTDTIFSVAGVPVTIEFRYRYLTDSVYNDWQTVESGTGIFAGCGSLYTSFTGVSARQTNNDLKVTFNNENEGGIIKYNIQVSKDSKRWDTIKSITPTNSHEYSASMNMAITGALMFPLLFVSFRRKFLGLILGLSLIVLLFACKKNDMKSLSSDQYRYVRIESVTNQGLNYSPVTNILK